MYKKTSLVRGAIILIFAGFLNRILGFIYRIFFVRTVGPEGVGLFEMIFPFYTLVLVITTAGVPPAISKLVSEQISLGNYRQAKKIFYVALSFLIIAGFVFTILLFLLAPLLVRTAFPDPRVYWCLITLIPAVSIISISSAFRGYFLGLQQMLPPALGQIIEQTVRVFSGIYLAKKFLFYGIEFGVAGLAAGNVLGELIGLIFLMFMYSCVKKPLLKQGNDIKGKGAKINTFVILKKIFSFSIPVTLTRLANSILAALQAILIPQRLQAAGYTFRQATELYGQFSGIALVLLGIPSIITFSLGTTLVPAISEAGARKDYRLMQDRCYKAIQTTLITGLPATLLFFLFPVQLCSITFDTPQAGKLLQVMALGSIFLYIAQTSSGILQGLGKVRTYLQNSLLGAVLNLIGIYYLTSQPTLGIMGTAMSMNIGWITMALLNMVSIFSYLGISFNFFKLFIVPAFGISVMGAATYTAYTLFWYLSSNYIFAVMGSITLGLSIYVIYLFISGMITKEDMAKFPGIGSFFNGLLIL
ncbi:MAG: stage V sporulation protein B [Clostridia bacterium]|nr:stage V sporulation protein B [Clostridia bacterium]